MMCSGARDYACRNAATFDGREAGPRLAAALLAAVEALQGYDTVFLEKSQSQAAARRTGRAAELRQLDGEVEAAGSWPTC